MLEYLVIVAIGLTIDRLVFSRIESGQRPLGPREGVIRRIAESVSSPRYCLLAGLGVLVDLGHLFFAHHVAQAGQGPELDDSHGAH